MTDMLVKLYDLPRITPPLSKGIAVHRALGSDKDQITTWVTQTFSQGWSEECASAFDRQPAACFVARENQRLIGFCVYDATALGMMGPVGVAVGYHGQGVGRHLVVTTLKDMAARGYAYAVVGWVGPQAFFTHTVGAIPIPGSSPGIYRERRSGTAAFPRSGPSG